MNYLEFLFTTYYVDYFLYNEPIDSLDINDDFINYSECLKEFKRVVKPEYDIIPQIKKFCAEEVDVDGVFKV